MAYCILIYSDCKIVGYSWYIHVTWWRVHFLVGEHGALKLQHRHWHFNMQSAPCRGIDQNHLKGPFFKENWPWCLLASDLELNHVKRWAPNFEAVTQIFKVRSQQKFWHIAGKAHHLFGRPSTSSFVAVSTLSSLSCSYVIFPLAKMTSLSFVDFL